MKNNIYLVHLFDWTKFICKFKKFLQKCLVDNFLTQSGQSILLKITSKTFTCRTRLFMALEVMFYIEKKHELFCEMDNVQNVSHKITLFVQKLLSNFSAKFFLPWICFLEALTLRRCPKKSKKIRGEAVAETQPRLKPKWFGKKLRGQKNVVSSTV